MDQKIVERMKEVDAAVKKLDSAVRGEAFAMMRDYILAEGGDVPREPSRPRAAGGQEASPKNLPKSAPTDFNAFIDTHEGDTPADNAVAIAAYLYGRYGIEPFALQEVRDLAEDGGVTIPARIDMTFLQKKVEKKKLFKRAGTGRFRPTVHGEAHVKETYGVKKGTKKRPVVES
jgi:hypothetical protein